VNCAACGAENPTGSKFCSECGTPLATACPSCGAPVPAAAKFCNECGLPLAGTAPINVQAGPAILGDGPAAERKLVSVLFADLVGFTTLSESRDAEEVRDLLTRYFDASRLVIARYGGTIEKFIGDAVMAVWGTPVTQEDDAERAVRAALDLTQAVAALGTEIGAPDLRARAGVLTGEAAVTVGAEGQGMVAGDLVNTASRIQSVAQPGSVLVGEATKRATEAAIAYEDAGSHELKGKTEPVPLWRADRVVGLRGGAMKSTGLEPPFVGRDRELRLVKELFHASAEDHKAHIVSVVGIGGIGKSRLSWEFFKYIDGLAERFLWHRGRCLSYGEGVAYWALAEMVRMRAGILEAEDQASAMEKLKSTISEYVPDRDEGRWLEPRLAHLLGLEERTASREDLFSAWRLFFERLAQQAPAVLVFEDMQWADEGLLDFIEYLLEWSKNHPLYVVALARPELTDSRPTWGAGSRNFTSLYLEPLSPDAMDELLSGLVPGLPAELHARILERAEGVPLYAMETVRMLLDRGVLVRDGSAYRSTGTVGTLEVPETLHALIAARLDGLSPEERRLIQDASVLGKAFFKQGVAALSGLHEADLEPLLASLVRKEVLTLHADPRSPERGQYGFIQELVKRIAYETISKRERKAKHLAAAVFIEQGWGGEEEEIVEVLASHYLEAYRAAPDAADAEDIRSKARDMLARAGERAASLAASGEAQRYFEQAIDLTDRPDLQADLHERAGRMARNGGKAEDAKSHYERAMALFESRGLTHPAARVSARLGELEHLTTLRIGAAIERMERAFEVLMSDEPDEDLGALAAQLGRLHWLRGDLDLASQRIELALEIAQQLRLPEVLSQALITKGGILSFQGRIEEETALVEHALSIALEHGISSAALRAYYNHGETLECYMDRADERLRLNEQALEVARKVGDRPWEGTFLACSISPLVSTGRWDEALAHVALVQESPAFASSQLVSSELLPAVRVHLNRGNMKEAEALLASAAELEQTEDVQYHSIQAAAQAAILLAQGRPAEAWDAGQRAFRLADQIGWGYPGVKEGLVQAAEAALTMGDLAKADEIVSLIEGLKPGQRPPFVDAQRARFEARLADARGESSEIVAPGFKTAVGMFRELSMPFWLAVTLLEYGEWLTAHGRSDNALPLIAEAREIFERLKAKPWLDRAEAVTAREVATASGSP
jgi:class 3 adenylate cyclase/tetratricopeptide (TPR) repeat protein